MESAWELLRSASCPKDRHFSTEDLDLLAVLAGYAAMALENANLYHSVETKALELEHLKAYTENIIESINVAVLALDLSGRITSCNRAFEELYGTTRQQIIGLAGGETSAGGRYRFHSAGCQEGRAGNRAPLLPIYSS